MNILIPHNWLLEHLETKATPQQISKYLSLCGPSVEHVETIEGKPVYDIEITTNRVDSMSIRGIAREASVILPEFGIPAKLKSLPPTTGIKHQQPLDIKIINDPKLCHRILAIKLENINLKPSPQWLQNRLQQIKQRPLNNIIDITNYVMWEIGHPIHAFDYDRITNKKIIIREAKKGETLITLDGIKHILNGGEVIFDDGNGNIIDLPGIMGTKNTIVTPKTKNILLWIESIDAIKIRQTSMNLSIRSQAAILNEKNVDPELGIPAIHRAITLAQKIANAQIGSQLTNIYPHPPKIKTTKISQKIIDNYLGLHIQPKRIIRILKNLGCKIETQNLSTKTKPETYQLTPPTFRANDLQIAQDYIEEIARIYGYHNLPSIIMDTPIPDNPPKENFELEYVIKQHLSGWGLQEVYSYSLISKKLINPNTTPLKITNPLTDDLVYLRKSIIPSHLQIIKQNKNHDSISIFEMANIYETNNKTTEQPNSPVNEVLQLVITTTKDYNFIKGILDALFENFFLGTPKITPKEKIISSSPFKASQAGHIIYNKKNIGIIGQVDTEKTIFAIQLNIKKLTKIIKTHPKHIYAHTTPPIIEDLTFTFPLQTHVQPVINHIKTIDPLIAKVKLTDRYQNAITFNIHYQNPNTNLTDQDVAPIRAKIVKSIETKFQAKLKGKLETQTTIKKPTSSSKITAPKLKLEDQQIYYQHPYQTKLDCQIVDVKEKGKLFDIQLDKTIFYPEGGGQPSDIGTIGNSKVLHTGISNDKIIHQIKGQLKTGDKVKTKLNWNHRYKFMKIHTAGHLIHDIFMSMTDGLTPIKGNHGQNAYLEYRGNLHVNIQKQLEQKVNQIINENLPVITKQTTYRELAKNCQFLPPNLPKNKPLRMIKIGNYPPMPDGGVHVKTTKEIGRIQITKFDIQDQKIIIYYQVIQQI